MARRINGCGGDTTQRDAKKLMPESTVAALTTSIVHTFVNNKPARLLVDSGSDISLVYKKLVSNRSRIASGIPIYGLAGGITSLGRTRLRVRLGTNTYTQAFEVVGDALPLPVDGILGRNFLTRYGVQLDFDEGNLVIGRNIIPLVPSNPQILLLAKESRDAKVLEVLEIEVRKSPSAVQQRLRELLTQFLDVFRMENETIPANNFYVQRITLRDKAPVYVPQYRLPNAHKAMMREQIEELLAQGIIRPSTSYYNNPNLMVPKKNGKWRMVTDFRQLNKKVVPDKYPLPRFDDIFDGLGTSDERSNGPKFFSTFDLTKGFYQIPLEKSSCKYTAFNAGFGFFEYVRLPFGISMAPNSFSRMMAHAFQSVIGAKGFVFMDDLVVRAETLDGHLEVIQEVLQICRQRQLSLNPAKLKFFQATVIYLGHELTANGIYPDSQKFESIKKYPRPRDKDEVKRFVSLASYYRRFIKFFAHIADPLNFLTKKTVPFLWTDDCENSFNKLKEKLMKPPLLIYPNFTQTFIIYSDASNVALGAVLGQEVDNIFRPVHYASRSLKSGERNKSTIEKELLAIHWSITYFKPYVYGTRFIVRSDHRPLVYLFSLRDPTSKLNRIRLELQEFSFDVQYVKGKDNVIADALSRVSIEDLKNQFCTVLAVTTRLQARRESELLKDGNTSKPAKAKDARDGPLKTNIENNGIPEKFLFLEANSFAARKFPEIIFDLGAGQIMAGYNLRKRTRKRLLIMIKFRKYKDVEEKEMLGADLVKALGELNAKAMALKIKNFRLSLDDQIFTIFTRNDLENYAQGLNAVKIFLYRAPINVRENKTEFGTIEQLIKRYHNDPLTGAHNGCARLLAKLKMAYYWKGMSRDVKRHARSCEKCKMNKPSKQTVEKLCITETPEKAFDILSIDTVGPLPPSTEGFKYLLTLQCNLTKFVAAVPMATKSAKDIAIALFEGFVYTHGFFKVIRSDLGTEFCNSIFEELMDFCQIKHNKSAGYRPQTIGGLERNHRVLNEYLRHYLNEGQTNWPQLIKSYVFAYNTTPNSTISDYTPYELVYGKLPVLPDYLHFTRVEPVYDIENYAKLLKIQLHTTQLQARTHLLNDKLERKRKYDEKSVPLKVELGDAVKVINEARTKLDPKYKGPYRVVRLETPNVYLQKPDGSKVIKVHKDRVAKC